MRIMSNTKRTIILSSALSQRACTYSVLRRTYSLLHQKLQASFSPPCTLQLSSAQSHPLRLRRSSHSVHGTHTETTKNRLTSPSSRRGFQFAPCVNGCRPFSSGWSRLCESSVNTDLHKPKREGELLKYTSLLRSAKQRFILTPSLARTVRELIWPGTSLQEETATIITANEGPGFMSQELLDHGASKVLALCRQEQFGPALDAIRTRTASPDNFQWQHADIYQMQFIGDRETTPPVVRLENVFQDIDHVAWEEDMPLKVIGALPQDGERKQAYLLASLILERQSMFSYGRVQLNVFMSKNCYNTLIHPPGNMKNYRALSALYQVSCNIRLLHMEPAVSFKLPRKSRPNSSSAHAAEKKLEDLCFVQITPKRDLFSRCQLEQWESSIFVFFIRQALAKRKENLWNVVEAWAPGSGKVISEFGYTKKTVTGEVTGDHLLAIFCRICKLDNFNGAWMGEEVMGWASGRSHDMNTMELSQALGSMNIS